MGYLFFMYESYPSHKYQEFKRSLGAITHMYIYLLMIGLTITADYFPSCAKCLQISMFLEK